MTANTSPIFTLTPKIGSVTASAANTARDGTGTLVTVLTAGSNGTMVERVHFIALSTTTAGFIRLFVDNGSSRWLYEEISVSAATPSASVAASTGSSSYITPSTPLVLPTGYTLKASTHNAESINVIAEGGDF